MKSQTEEDIQNRCTVGNREGARNSFNHQLFKSRKKSERVKKIRNTRVELMNHRKKRWLREAIFQLEGEQEKQSSFTTGEGKGAVRRVFSKGKPPTGGGTQACPRAIEGGRDALCELPTSKGNRRKQSGHRRG